MRKASKKFYVYIVASKRNGTLYIGLTSNLEQRVRQHKTKIYTGFTAKYEVSQLVHFEEYQSFEDAYLREKRMKKWKRAWKINLIEKNNPYWRDLYE